MPSLEALAGQYDALEAVDKSPFQRKARILQAMWRQKRRLPICIHASKRRGASMDAVAAEASLANYLTPLIRQVVRREVLDPTKSEGKMYGRPRIFNSLLSSQPLAFNLFAPLKLDLRLATQVLGRMTRGRCYHVTGIEFEYSPGRRDPRYLGDRSAFDVFVTFQTKKGDASFLGIEVKYHENLLDSASGHHARYDEVAQAMGCFLPSARDNLRTEPLQQIWRDHLLCGCLAQADGFAEGTFILLSPRDNTACSAAIDKYRRCLSCDTTFEHWTLEALVRAIRHFRDDKWIHDFHDRYLDFRKVEKALRSRA